MGHDGVDVTILVNERGTPEPPTEIVARLQRVHPGFGLRYAEGHAGINWHFTKKWEPDDTRREWIKDGSITPDSDYDIIGPLPIDCSLGEAAGYAERALGSYPVESVSKLRNEMHKYNTVDIPKAQVQDAVAATMDDFATSKRQKNPRRTKV